MTKKLILFTFLFNFFFSQSEHPFPPLELVTVPTAGTMPRGSYSLESLLAKEGSIITKLAVGFTDSFTFGVSFGLQNFIGEDKPSLNRPTPEVQIKYRVFDETEIYPALTYGLDTQGRGKYISEQNGLESGNTTIERYEQKAWGMYLVLSKNWDIFGNCGVHVGLNKNYWEISDGDKDVNLFIGVDKEINRSFSILLEYDAALNDNDYRLNDLSFGKGKGYLNAGLRWTIANNFLVEINLNNINKNTDASYTNRQIKIIYSEIF